MGRRSPRRKIGAPVRVLVGTPASRRTIMLKPEITDVGSEDFLVWDDCSLLPQPAGARDPRLSHHRQQSGHFKAKQKSVDLESDGGAVYSTRSTTSTAFSAVDRARGLESVRVPLGVGEWHARAERYGPPHRGDV